MWCYVFTSQTECIYRWNAGVRCEYKLYVSIDIGIRGGTGCSEDTKGDNRDPAIATRKRCRALYKVKKWLYVRRRHTRPRPSGGEKNRINYIVEWKTVVNLAEQPCVMYSSRVRAFCSFLSPPRFSMGLPPLHTGYVTSVWICRHRTIMVIIVRNSADDGPGRGAAV